MTALKVRQESICVAIILRFTPTAQSTLLLVNYSNFNSKRLGSIISVGVGRRARDNTDDLTAREDNSKAQANSESADTTGTSRMVYEPWS